MNDSNLQYNSPYKLIYDEKVPLTIKSIIAIIAPWVILLPFSIYHLIIGNLLAGLIYMFTGILIFLSLYIKITREYLIYEDCIIIIMNFHKIRILFSDIISEEILQKNNLYGSYDAKRCISGTKNACILIMTKNRGDIVIQPKDAKQFLDIMRKQRAYWDQINHVKNGQ